MMLFLETTDLSRLANLGRFLAAYWPVLLPPTLGFLGIYWLLPQARGSKPLLGGFLAGLALVVAGWTLVRTGMISVEAFLFYAFSGTAILGGAKMVTQKNPVYAALSFALVVLSSCGLFLLQGAPFLMAATIIIYAGAIVVTFLFVIMLAQQEGMVNADQRSREPFLASLSGFLLMGAILCVLDRNFSTTKLDLAMAQVWKASQGKTLKEVEAELGDPKFLDGLRDLVAEPKGLAAAPGTAAAERFAFVDALERSANAWMNQDLPALTASLKAVADAGQRVRQFQGNLQPKPELPLSPYAGIPPNAPLPAPGEVPRERLPAANVQALGRTLFTDYLLAVELAGVILTVASIGAIVISGRRTEGLK